MANILEFLRGVLTSQDEQLRFRGNPHGYVTAHGFADLSGEDIVEAVKAMRSSMSPEIAAALAPYEGNEDGLPPVRPLVGETDLDAAVRQMLFLASLTPAPTAAPAPEPPAPEPEAEPVRE